MSEDVVLGLSILLESVDDEGPVFVGRLHVQKGLTLKQTYQVLTTAKEIITEVLGEAQGLGEFIKDFDVDISDSGVDTLGMLQRMPLE